VGIVGRLRSRRRGTAEAAESRTAASSLPDRGVDDGSEVGAGAGAGSTSSGYGSGSGARVPSAGWSALPPIQRATTDGRPGVADAGFAARLTTWQNPSFTGTLSHAVLDDAPSGLVKGVLVESRGPGTGLELPSLSLPLAMPEVEPAGGAAVAASAAASGAAPSAPSGPSVQRVRFPGAVARATAPGNLTR